MISEKNLEFLCDVSGIRLDKYLISRLPDYSRSQLQGILKRGLITVNNTVVKTGYKLKSGDLIRVSLPTPSPVSLEAQHIPLKIVYSDKDIIVLDKPAGLVVHPAPGHPDHTLVNALLSLFPELYGQDESYRPGIVHRLDKDTSGLMVVAMNAGSRENLMGQMKNREITKKYYALLEGQQGIYKSMVGMTRSRMHYQAGRFIQYDNVFIAIDYF